MSWFLKPSNVPKPSSIAAASSPSGLPPPSGERFSQNIEWRTWPERWNARFFCSWLIVPKSSDAAGLVELLERGVGAVDVRLVVLVVVELEDLGRVVGLEGGVVVRELGERVDRHGRLLHTGVLATVPPTAAIIRSPGAAVGRRSPR